MKTLVVIGCSAVKGYHFLLPVTCLFWRDLIGLSPRTLLVGTEEEWSAFPRSRTALEALRHHDIDHGFVECPSGYEVKTIAQNLRQHAAADSSIPDDSWIMPADADLWPLRRDFYHQHEAILLDRYQAESVATGLPANRVVVSGPRAACYYANGDHFTSKEDVLERASRGMNSQTIPTCHAVLRAADWRAIYDLAPDQIAASTRRTLDAWIPPRVRGRDPGLGGFLTWMSDQQILTEMLCRQDWFPQEALMIYRHGHPPVDRLDRSVAECWEGGYDPTRWTDAHVHNETPWSEGEWSKLLRVVESALPEHAAWARGYREAYVNA